MSHPRGLSGVHKDGSGQGRADPLGWEGHAAPRHGHPWSTGRGAEGVPGCPVARALSLPGVGSLSCHLAPCPTAVEPWRRVSPRLQHPWEDKGKEFWVLTRCSLSLPLSCPVALRLTEAIPAHSRGKGSRGAERSCGAARGRAVLRASRCSRSPGRLRCHRRCFAASLREDAAGGSGSHSLAVLCPGVTSQRRLRPCNTWAELLLRRRDSGCTRAQLQCTSKDTTCILF